MRVSELAKELGYKAAELVELAQAKGIKVADARANIDARMAAAVRAQVPHRSKLSGPLMDVYARVVAEEAAKATAKAAEPKTARKKKEPAEPGAEPKPKRTIRKKKEPAAPVVEMAGKPAKTPSGKVAPVKKVKVVEEFRLSDAQKAAPVSKIAARKTEDMSPEEQAELKKEASKPLIDVDNVIGVAKEVNVVRPIEIEVFQRDKDVKEQKDRRVVRAPTKTQPPTQPVHSTSIRHAPPTRPPLRPPMRPYDARRHQKPRVPPAAMRSTVQAPRPRPVVTPMSERKIEIQVPISLKNFCEQTGIKVNHVMKKLVEQGAIITINHLLDEGMVGVLAAEFKPLMQIIN